MFLVDSKLQALEAEGSPIRVGLIGLGHVGRMIFRQIQLYTPGMEVSAVYNRTKDRISRVCRELEASPAVFEDFGELCTSDLVDVVVDATGEIEFGTQVALAAIEAGKHLVEVNAELDGTLGPILKRKADDKGLVYTGMDGDQPGTQLNLLRFVRLLGLHPVISGNVKGFLDRYRTPESQVVFARDNDLTPRMATHFADGTKVAIEQAQVANATGMEVCRRGMLGPDAGGADATECMNRYPLQDALDGPGYVEYLLGGTPGPGVFVIAHTHDPYQQRELKMLKQGNGPFYCFTRPYHLCGFEVPGCIARAVCYGDAVVVPMGPPVVEVVAAAKRPLKAGTKLDDYGGFCTYGLAENSRVVQEEKLVPIGLVKDATVKRNLGRDHLLTLDDVELVEDRLSFQLYQEQRKMFREAALCSH